MPAYQHSNSWRRFARRGRTIVFVVLSAIVLLLVGWSAAADAVLTRPALPPPGDDALFADVDGVRTYYGVSGQGPALVLLHGLGSSHLTWHAVESAFAERFTVYTLDLPGFGYSDKPAGYASARQEATFVDHFLARVGVERATVIGHSLGGDVALWQAVDHPGRVERLVLVNAAEVGDSAMVFQLAATPILGDMMLKTTTTPATLRATMGGAYLHPQALTPELAAQYSRIYWTPGARQALVELSRSYDADRSALLTSLDGVQAPTLIVWTDRDPYFPVSVAERLHALLPRAELRVIGDAGDLPQEEQPAAFLDVVRAWLG